MDKIEDFIRHYFELEAECKLLRRKEFSLEAYNAKLELLHNMVSNELVNQLGMIPLKRPKGDRFYKRFINSKVPVPRHLYKISEYCHSKYQEVWIAYCSLEDPQDDIKGLQRAFFISTINGELRILKVYAYSSYSSDGLQYKWEEGIGIDGLTFETLEGPTAIKRIMEPSDYLESLKLYSNET